jgi:hypothetical protein
MRTRTYPARRQRRFSGTVAAADEDTRGALTAQDHVGRGEYSHNTGYGSPCRYIHVVAGEE